MSAYAKETIIITTTTLPNGLRVVARTNQEGVYGPLTYTNSAQALRKLRALTAAGIAAHITESGRGKTRIRYIVLD